MTNRPRPSLLDLFDPLLDAALHVPIPESPTDTPIALPNEPDCDSENKENVFPEELTMSVYFKRTAPNAKPKKSPGVERGPLIDLADSEDTTVAVFRPPLADISIGDSTRPVTSRSLNKAAQKKPSPSMLPPKSPSHISQSTPAHFPPISIIDSPRDGQPYVSHFSQLSLNHTEGFSVNEHLIPDSHKTSLTPSEAHHTSTHRMQQSHLRPHTGRRSSLSSNSFLIPEASFDLVNGEISFLSKSISEVSDNSHEVSQEGTGRIIKSPQEMIASQGFDLMGVKALSRKMEKGTSPSEMTPPHFDDRFPTSEENPTETVFERKFDASKSDPDQTDALYRLTYDRQRTSSTVSDVSTATVHADAVVPQRPNETLDSLSSQANSERQNTPLKRRRISLVPAPVKKTGLFAPGHNRRATASKTRSAIDELLGVRHGSTLKAKDSKANGVSNILARDSKEPTSIADVPMSRGHDPKPVILQGPRSINAKNASNDVVLDTPSSSLPRKINLTSHVTRTNGNKLPAPSKLPCRTNSFKGALPKAAATSRLPAPSGVKAKESTISKRPISKTAGADGTKIRRAL